MLRVLCCLILLKLAQSNIKAYKRQQGERIAVIAADIGLAEMNISDEEWKAIFHELTSSSWL